MPLATSSQAVMPPKTLTKTDLTCSSWRITSSPLAITSALAPPPMSRKLAGVTPPCFSPAYATTSRVDMTSPAPLPMMPTAAVELDVVEALRLGLGLQRVGRVLVLELRVVLVAELGVLVEGDLAVERLELVAGQPGQRVDLDQGGVLLDEDRPQRLHQRDGLVAQRVGERRPRRRSRVALASSTPVPASIGIFLTASGLVLATSSISTPPSTRGDAQVGAVGAVEQEGEVVLLLDLLGGHDQHPVDREALDRPCRGSSEACSSASSGVLASFTPPALPRPPALTCALTTTAPPISSAAALASAAVSTVLPRVTGTSCLAKSSFAWYSIRSTGQPLLFGGSSGCAHDGLPHALRRP